MGAVKVAETGAIAMAKTGMVDASAVRVAETGTVAVAKTGMVDAGARVVHGLSQPGFGPNPHSTRLGGVTEKRTRNQSKYGLNPSGQIIGSNG